MGIDRTNAARQARWRQRRQAKLAALEAEVASLRARLASPPPVRRRGGLARVAALAGRPT
jgi:hypothetical protein